METNDSGNFWINMPCRCNGRLCKGELTIQPDREEADSPDQKVIRTFYVGVVNGDGSDESIIWLSSEQLSELIPQLQILLDTYGE